MRVWLMLVVAATALGAWLIAFSFLVPLHRAVFVLIPTDGLVVDHQRAAVDSTVTNYLLGGPATSDLTSTEWSHLEDVQSRLVLLGGFTLAGLLIAGFHRPTPHELGRAGLVVLGLSIVALIVFPSFFVVFHQVVFPAGNWELPSSEFLLTRIYPFGFFVAGWCTAAIGAATTLWLCRLLPELGRGIKR